MAEPGDDISWADREPDASDGAGVGLPAFSSSEKPLIKCLIQDG